MATKKAQPKKKPDGTLAKKEKAIKEFGIFDFITSVSDSKEDLIRKSDDPEATAKLYNPYMTNRALSYHSSSILQANMMNGSHQLDKLLQFDFLLHSVRKEKRFSKWWKPVLESNVELLAKHYGCNIKRALEYVSILTEDQLNVIRQLHDYGGVGGK